MSLPTLQDVDHDVDINDDNDTKITRKEVNDFRDQLTNFPTNIHVDHSFFFLQNIAKCVLKVMKKTWNIHLQCKGETIVNAFI